MNREDIACTNKARYLTRIEAKRSAKVAARKHGVKGLVPYRCEFCTMIHLGHRPGFATHKRFSILEDRRTS